MERLDRGFVELTPLLAFDHHAVQLPYASHLRFFPSSAGACKPKSPVVSSKDRVIQTTSRNKVRWKRLRGRVLLVIKCAEKKLLQKYRSILRDRRVYVFRVV